MGKLVSLAQNYFKEKSIELTPSEIKLLGWVEAGETADYQKHDNDCTLRAEIINWLCSDKEASSHITYFGLQIGSAKIIGRLELSFAEMEYPLLLGSCSLPNGIDISYARVNLLGLSGSHIASEGDPDNVAFLGDGLVVKGSLFFRAGAEVRGKTKLVGAEIGGQLTCRGSSFINRSDVAFSADQIIVKGSVLLDEGANFYGMTRLLGATIGGELNCIGGSFINSPNIAFGAENMIVKGNVLFRDGAKFEGETRLGGAKIDGNLECKGSSFINPCQIAFNGDRMIVRGSIFLSDKARIEGETRLCGAQIGSQLALDKSVFLNVGKTALNLQGVRVSGTVLLNEISDIKGNIDFTDASVNTLKDDAQYWKSENKMLINGFTYERIECDEKLLKAKERIKWLSLQPDDKFRPQAYDQLAKVFRKMGRERDARKISIAKEKDKWKHLRRFKRWCGFLFGLFLGYGYKPWRALTTVAIILILVGCFEFNNANRNGLMAPTKFSNLGPAKTFEYSAEEISYPPFNAYVYSIDAFLPIVDLHQESSWLPKYDKAGVSWVWWYLWFHIVMGWILTTMIAAAITGLMRRK